MGKSKKRTVKVITRISRQSPAARLWNTADAIQLIVDQRMSGRRQMDAYLVRPAGNDLHLHKRAIAAPFQYAHTTARRFSGSVIIGNRRMNCFQKWMRNPSYPDINIEFISSR